MTVNPTQEELSENVDVQCVCALHVITMSLELLPSTCILKVNLPKCATSHKTSPCVNKGLAMF